MYRGKDFLPPSVATALAERQEMTKQSQTVEEEAKIGPSNTAPVGQGGEPLAGTLAEFYEAQARWGREISRQDRETMIEEASRSKTARVVKRLEHKLAIVSVPFKYGIFLRMHVSVSVFNYQFLMGHPCLRSC